MGVVILTAEQLAYVFPLFFMIKKRCSSNSRRAQEVCVCVVWRRQRPPPNPCLCMMAWSLVTLQADGAPHFIDFKT